MTDLARVEVVAPVLTPAHLSVLSYEDAVALLVDAFCRAKGRKSDHTERNYRRDLAHWVTFGNVAALNILTDPLGVHVEAFIAQQQASTPTPAAATVARRVSAVSSWYRWLVRDGHATRNPCDGVDRPYVDYDESTTIGLSREQAAALLDAAEANSDGRAARERDYAMLMLLVGNGLRGGELLAIDVEDFGISRGHRTIRLTRKGGKRRVVPLSPATSAALDVWLVVRGGHDGPLFSTRTGKRCVHTVLSRAVKRAALLAHQARPDLGMDLVARRISPHSIRHTAITLLLDAGTNLRDTQDFAGHADPRTTRRYDRNRNALDRHGTYALSAHIAAARRGRDEDEPF
jgi:integrase/recombinase XerD